MASLPRLRPALPAWAWLLLLVAGQGAALSLIEAGTRVSYQHYRLAMTGPGTWVALGVLVVQAALVLAALGSVRSAVGGWLARHLPPAARWLLVGALVACSATASKDVGFYLRELVASTAIQLIAIANVVVLAASLNAGAMAVRLRRLLGAPGDPSRGPGFDAFAMGCALWVLVASVALATWSYQRHPHVPDEVAYLLQANYFAHGMLTMPLPPAPLAFNVDLMYYDAARWFTSTPPGWPLALAVGVKLGVPWLVNPVLGALDLLLAHAVLVSMYERRVARLATLLLACSPWFVFMSMNFMTHQVVLFLALLATMVVARVRADRARDGRVRPSSLALALPGGLAIGAASLVRPLEGLTIAMLLGLWSLPPQWWRHLRRVTLFAPSVALAVGSAAGASLVRPYNRAITGDPSYFPIMAYVDRYYGKGSNDLGFGANRGMGWPGLDPFPGHGALDVVVNANLNATTLGQELLGWATGSLLAIFLLLALRRMQREDWWHVAVVAVVVGMHSFYWFSGGPDFGPRYWYLIIVSCAALSARGLVSLGDALAGDQVAEPEREAAHARTMGAGLALTFAALVTFVPWRAVDKYHHFRGMRPDIREIAARQPFGRALVFVRGNRHPDYASAVPYNPIDLTAGVPLYAWDASPEARDQALAAYPDRPVWFVDGPTRTRSGFSVVAGPLTTEQARRYSGR